MAGYVGNAPLPQATQTRDLITATAGQTTFPTGGYTPQFLDVHLNGILLVTEQTIRLETVCDVVLTVGESAGDILSVIAYSTFEVANVSWRWYV